MGYIRGITHLLTFYWLAGTSKHPKTRSLECQKWCPGQDRCHKFILSPDGHQIFIAPSKRPCIFHDLFIICSYMLGPKQWMINICRTKKWWKLPNDAVVVHNPIALCKDRLLVSCLRPLLSEEVKDMLFALLHCHSKDVSVARHLTSEFVGKSHQNTPLLWNRREKVVIFDTTLEPIWWDVYCMARTSLENAATKQSRWQMLIVYLLSISLVCHAMGTPSIMAAGFMTSGG